MQEKLLESDAAPKLQEIPAPERFDDAERLCFEQCFAGLGQSEAAQECERLDYYSARFVLSILVKQISALFVTIKSLFAL